MTVKLNNYKQIKIGVSSCLAGYNVRHDGKNKKNNVIEQLCKTFNCITICPESHIGLGTPRPPLQLVKIGNAICARGKTNPEFDVTHALNNCAKETIVNQSDMCGYVFKARSPSCGINSSPWFDASRKHNGLTSGIYSAQIQALLPQLPVIEELQLETPDEFNSFVSKVKEYAEHAKKNV